MDLPEFTLAVLVLLATPGPTNTLLWLAAYGRGATAAAHLLAGEIGGYLSVIVPVAVLAAPLIEAHPAILPAMKLGAGLWVLLLAAWLWQQAGAATPQADGTLARVYLTTLLNPKAPIVALVLMPHGPLAAIWPWLAAFSALTLMAGVSWIVAGSLFGRASGSLLSAGTVRRAAAACLACFSLALAGSSLGALL